MERDGTTVIPNSRVRRRIDVSLNVQTKLYYWL